MFNSLASYILGNGNRNSTNIIQSDQNLSGASDETINNFKFVTTSCEDDEEDEWLLVEKEEGDDNTPQQTDSEEEIPFVEIKNNPIIRTRHSRNNSNVGSHDGAFSLLPSSPIPNSMDESWFVTPPPCFTSTGPRSVDMETSPLENLLIEHPSMSVYHSIRSSLQPNNAEDDTDDQDGLVLVNMNVETDSDTVIHPASDRASGQTTRITRSRAESHVNNLTAQQVKQVVALKHSQKANEKKCRQQMCRNAIERGNKVREVNSKGGRQKRSDMTHCKVISRVNNNRKC